ncbi:unnamed protein product [Linum trigynum]|uniref:Myb-like domain-containing protein n=1 Tax=Linum trigynum TaxID=586398 RepID=A0AAV2DWS8_9ROSI
MDDTEDDARYPPNLYENHQQQKLRVVDQYGSDDDNDEEDPSIDEDDDEELVNNEGGENNNLNNGKVHLGKDVEDVDDDDNVEFDDDHVDDDDSNEKKYDAAADVDNAANLVRHPKKRKLKSLVSSYEFAPRVPPPPLPIASILSSKPSFAGRNPLTDWTEQETFVLLDSWGDKFLQRGRKSLRSDEWLEVAKKVSEVSKVERTDTQCRNRLDTLKKKYKKEKGRLVGSLSNRWVYFKKMDMLMSTSAQLGGSGLLSCGLDSGEYVFRNPRVYLNRPNGLDEMRDSPGNSDDDDDDNDEEEDDSDGLPPKKRWSRRDQNEEGSEFRLLADSIEKFSEIYEKIEMSKRQQMVELEKMRMDFHKDLEMQKREIMERVQSEIAKIQEEDSGVKEQPGISVEDASG